MRRPGSRFAPKIIAFVALAVLCAAPPSTLARAESAPALAVAEPAVDREKLFDAVVDAIQRRFVDEQILKRIDWPERARATRPAVLAAASTREAVGRINALLAELKTSHTGLYTPDDYQYPILLDIVGGGGNIAELIAEKFWGVGPHYPGVGIFTREIDKRHFVDGVMEGSPADRAGVKYGDEIISVDGAPYSPIAAFRGKIGATVALEFRRSPDAPSQKIDVAVTPIRPAAAFAAATRASARIIEKDGRRIGYVHVWSSNESRSFREALAQLAGESHAGSRGRRANNERQPPPDALIIDMRGRVGGNTGSAEEMLQALDDLQKPYWGQWRARDRSGENRRGWSRGNDAPQWGRSYRGRIALLINEHTRSAGEIFAYGFQRSGFGPLIGTRTAGAVTSGALALMPGDLLLYVGVSALEFENERRLEGEGVTPDHIVERPAPYAAGADPVLEAALERLMTAPL